MEIVEKSLNYFKSLTAETISNAKSGHTGSALGASSIMLALFHDHLVFDPTNPNWVGRDRFVLSAGHTSAMYYSLLHLFGYNISIDDLKNFRKCGSKTPGHPEYGIVPGAETTTGPLGQGVANAVGFALAEAKANNLYPQVFNNYTYCYAGDGCLMEGVAVEACSLAGTLGLNKLILLYDDNNITIDGARTLANKEDVKAKFESMGWNSIDVKNGHDYNACSKAIAKAKKSNKPTIIIFKTIIGIGTSKQGTEKSHAYPLPAEELVAFKQSLSVPESFFVSQDVYDFCHEANIRNKPIIENWNKNASNNKDALKRFLTPKQFNYTSLLNQLSKLPEQAGRDLSGIVLNALEENFNFFGGTADVGPSTKAVISKSEYFSAESRTGRNIHFGIREHSMGSICNAMALYGGFRIFDSTFMAFSNYMLPALKMRAMMNAPVLSVFTHDSIDIGEDGPTHQPIEQLSQIRSLVGLNVFRPANDVEMVAAYKFFVEQKKPTALVLTKSKLAKFEGVTLEDAEKGAYVIFETKTKPQIEIFATGKEVELAVSVAKELETIGARVISMPCESLFATQDKTYKSKIRVKSPVLKVAIEASNDMMWHKYVGENGLLVNVTDYQTSGKGSEVYVNAGFSKENVLKQIAKKIK